MLAFYGLELNIVVIDYFTFKGLKMNIPKANYTIGQIAHINVNGLNQIAEALGRHHKLGRDHFTPSMLNAWATDAEDHFNQGNGCYFEIRSFDTKIGTAVEVLITSDGYDIEDLNG